MIARCVGVLVRIMLLSISPLGRSSLRMSSITHGVSAKKKSSGTTS